VPKEAAGKLRFRGEVAYMACTPEFCDPPASDKFFADLVVEGAAAAAPKDPKPAQGPGVPTVSSLLRQPSKLQATPRFEPATAHPGEEIKLIVKVEVDDGWHVYGSKETHGIPIDSNCRPTVCWFRRIARSCPKANRTRATVSSTG